MILFKALIISLTILGFHVLIEQLIWHFYGLTLEDVYDKYNSKWFFSLFKPLFLCPLCMTSIWGTVLYLLTNSEYLLIEYITSIGLIGLFNYLGSKYLL